MDRLSIRLLGSFQVERQGEPVPRLKTDKVRALLAYLAVEADHLHRREKLAGLLWPDRPEQRARASLSQALYTLRRAIGDETAITPFILLTQEALQFNRSSHYWLDVSEFKLCLQALHHRPLDNRCLQNLEKALSLYRGRFLEGFSVGDSPAFEEWSLLYRERFHRQVIEATDRLIVHYEQCQAYETALRFAWRQVEMDSWREESHVAVMRLLARCGRRTEALAQYETCARILAEELNIAPQKKTTRLFEQIRDGQLPDQPTAPVETTGGFATTPPFLSTRRPQPRTSGPFVARDKELAILDRVMEEAFTGGSNVAFVAGDAGSGKTALIQAFARRAQKSRADLLVAMGKGSAYTGLGDPHAAFRAILAQLTGEVEAQWVAGAIHRDQAARLWRLLPWAVKALVDSAPDLVNTFVDGAQLLKRGAAYVHESYQPGSWPPWYVRLDDLIKRSALGTSALSPQQSALFDQYSRLLIALTSYGPMVLLLDDLQWADAGSIGLLFHLVRRLAGHPVLIVGAYRTEEISVGPDGKRHPFEPVLHEFQRCYGEIVLPVGTVPDRAFVEAIIASEPNELGSDFRENLFHLTGGHPLFTIEILRGLQERGDLFKDEKGSWRAGSSLDWDTLPPRVEGIIAERIGRLPDDLKRLLQVASVQGEAFVAEVVAQVLGDHKRQTIAALSGPLREEHRLVRAQSLRRLGPNGLRMSVYQFWHYLFQKYLYEQLDPIDRVHLHEATGNVLEDMYRDHPEDVVVQLARHYASAARFNKAIKYQLLAGNCAMRLSAHEEAIRYFNQALTLLGKDPGSPDQIQRELTLLLALGNALQASKGYADPEVERVYSRAIELCHRAGDLPQLVPALLSLAAHSAMVPNLTTALELSERALAVAQNHEESMLIAIAHQTVGYLLVHLGEHNRAHKHLEKMINFYNQREHAPLAFVYGHDYGVASRAWDAWALWFLGFPEQAKQVCLEAISLAEAVEHPFSLTLACSLAATVFAYLREPEAARKLGERVNHLVQEHGFVFYSGSANFALGWSSAASGRVEEGVAQMREGLAVWEALGARVYRRAILVFIADLHLRSGNLRRASSTIEEIEAMANLDAERYFDAELQRIKGELFLAQDHDAGKAEACIQRAIRIARRQKAKALELRAVTSLARLWLPEGRHRDACEQLSAILGWFTEGLDSPDLQEAKSLLGEISPLC